MSFVLGFIIETWGKCKLIVDGVIWVRLGCEGC
jgi:hypothetical protein